MVAGRPREYDRTFIAQRLIEWAQLPNSMNINAFLCLPEIMMSAKKLLQFVYDDEEFREVYETAKAFIASRREEAHCEKVLSDKAFAISHKVYDLIQKHEDREELKYVSDLSKQKPDDLENKEKIFDEGIKQLNQVLGTLSSERNIEDNKINNETKS